MKIFVLGLPHTQTLDPATSEHTSCAFTSQIWYLCRMMHRRGHEVIHLGVEGSKPECSEHVNVANFQDYQEIYLKRKPTEFYDTACDGPKQQYMNLYVARVKLAVAERTNKPWSAIVCNTFGAGAQQTACTGLSQFVVESGVGYNHPWADYRVYPSYAWMHFNLGVEKMHAGDKWYYVMIQHAFDPDLFGPCVETKQEYALYMGRLNEDKGVRLACDVARKVGLPIKIVGMGNPAPYLARNVEYLKPVGSKDRNELLRYAKVLFCPTRYVEPFGGIAVEAALAGCPVISTDWGGFIETVVHGVTGYRCRFLDQFIWAAKNIGNINPETCRKWAADNFSPDRIAPMYEEYFQMVLNRNSKNGWGAINDRRTELDWLKREYPS
jgi:glycosyltransferase involved in cell wall biosynthesis